jgi:hypothetical protein
LKSIEFSVSELHPNREEEGCSLEMSARIMLRLKTPGLLSPLMSLQVVGRAAIDTVESRMKPAHCRTTAGEKAGRQNKAVTVSTEFASTSTQVLHGVAAATRDRRMIPLLSPAVGRHRYSSTGLHR